MKYKIYLFLLFFLIGCNQFKSYIEVEVNSDVKVSSNYFTDKNDELIFAWTPPKSHDGIIPEFEINGNYLYFTPKNSSI